MLLLKPKTEVAFRHSFDVSLVDFMGDDLRVCQAARVSTQGAESYGSGESAGLIKFLLENRHGSPFEHILFTWMISCPIFVWREFMRHRIASYNEESGRYTTLKPVFYVPPRYRPLQQVGKPGHYEFVPGTERQYRKVSQTFRRGAVRQYRDYEALLTAGVAKEVSRMELPLNIYSTAYVTMNARALMNFLSLRIKDESSLFPSYPQWEIAQVAAEMERSFLECLPKTHQAFVNNRRVAP